MKKKREKLNFLKESMCWGCVASLTRSPRENRVIDEEEIKYGRKKTNEDDNKEEHDIKEEDDAENGLKRR